jgi:octaprenyl-diphosphate synthase
MGKPAAMDISGSILTLPILYGLHTSSNGNRDEVLRKIRIGFAAEDTEFIRDFAESSGGMDYARRKAEEHAEEAVSAISGFPGSDFRDAMEAIAEFVVSRDF